MNDKYLRRVFLFFGFYTGYEIRDGVSYENFLEMIFLFLFFYNPVTLVSALDEIVAKIITVLKKVL